MTALKKFDDEAPKVIAFGAAGVQEGVARQAESEIARKIAARFDNARLKSLRFVPSSKINTFDGTRFEILANSTIQFGIGQDEDEEGRSELVDSVVTVDVSGQDQRLADVSIPSFSPRR